MTIALTVALLAVSNAFMTFAWYGFLNRPGESQPRAWWKLLLLSWGVALFEYCFMVPANHIGRQAGLSLAQLETERFLGDALMTHHANGGFLLGICNGFQILTKLGILPRASLIWNKSERFECMWDKLVKVNRDCPFTRYLPDTFELPSAHAEGRLVTDPGDAQKYMDNGCVALQYADNHNGSELRIAGLQDPTGRAMGLMPHPERFLRPQHHYDPDWAGDADWGWGYYFFKGAFDALK